MAAFDIFLIAHAALAVFLIIELGLVAALVDWSNDWHYWGVDTPATYSFLMFTVVWSLLVIAYLALSPRFLPRIFHAMVALGLLLVTTIFWFAGSIALAVRTPDGDWCNTTGCDVAIAAVVFGFFIWAIFLGLAVVDTLAFLRGRGHAAHADTTHSKPNPYPGA